MRTFVLFQVRLLDQCWNSPSETIDQTDRFQTTRYNLIVSANTVNDWPMIGRQRKGDTNFDFDCLAPFRRGTASFCRSSTDPTLPALIKSFARATADS